MAILWRRQQYNVIKCSSLVPDVCDPFYPNFDFLDRFSWNASNISFLRKYDRVSQACACGQTDMTQPKAPKKCKDGNTTVLNLPVNNWPYTSYNSININCKKLDAITLRSLTLIQVTQKHYYLRYGTQSHHYSDQLVSAVRYLSHTKNTRSVNKVIRLPAYRTIWHYCGLALHMEVR